MTVTIAAPFISISAHDPDVASAFDRDAPGLEVRADVTPEGLRWVTLGLAGENVNIVPSWA